MKRIERVLRGVPSAVRRYAWPARQRVSGRWAGVEVAIAMLCISLLLGHDVYTGQWGSWDLFMDVPWGTILVCRSARYVYLWRTSPPQRWAFTTPTSSMMSATLNLASIQQSLAVLAEAAAAYAPPDPLKESRQHLLLHPNEVETEVVYGYRVYFATWAHDRFRETPIDYSTEPMFLEGAFGKLWRDTRMRAWCNSLMGDPYTECEEDLIDGSCSCGIWSYKSFDELALHHFQLVPKAMVFSHALSTSDNKRLVFARVVVSGIVIEHEHGYRSSVARIEKLFAPASLHEKLAHYGVPVAPLEEIDG